MAIELIEIRRVAEEGYDVVDYDIMLDGQAIGGVGVMTGDTTYVDTIVIDEERQNNGYGTETLQLLSEMYGGIYLAPDNEDARRLYERIGREYTAENAEYFDQGFGVYEI